MFQTEERGLWKPVQDRNEIVILGSRSADFDANDSEMNPPFTQQQPLPGGHVFVEQQHGVFISVAGMRPAHRDGKPTLQ